ncbi:MAG: hypothetical protein JWP58_3262 [Hymenobacter sp.]|nr:hypothetical protein [Hymenobacter sp.]
MLLDLPTRQDMEAIQAQLNAVLDLLARAPAPTSDDLLSVEQVAAYTRFDRRTVEKWVEEGQFNETGRKVYLPAHRYSGRLRFKRGDVEAFGLGIGVLTPSLGGGQPEAVKPAAKAPRSRKPAAVPSERALRKVA